MQRQKTDATTLPLPLYYLKRIPFLLIARNAVNKAIKIITPTETVKEEVKNYYKADETKIKAIYEGFSHGDRKENNINISSKALAKYKIDKPYFMYIGNAYPHKNIKKAIEAILILNKKTEEKIYLVIGGARGVFAERLNSEILSLKAENYVRLIGFVDDHDMQSLYENAVGFVYPSLAEGYGLQGLEAMGYGTLVLASNIAVFKELYGDYSFYFDPHSASSIAASMEYAITLDKPTRSQLISKAKEFIKKYSWKKMALETLQVYETALQNI